MSSFVVVVFFFFFLTITLAITNWVEEDSPGLCVASFDLMYYIELENGNLATQ